MDNIVSSKDWIENSKKNIEEWNPVFYDNSTNTKVEKILNNAVWDIDLKKYKNIKISWKTENFFWRFNDIISFKMEEIKEKYDVIDVFSQEDEVLDDVFSFEFEPWEILYYRDLLLSSNYICDILYDFLIKSKDYKNANLYCEEFVQTLFEYKKDSVKSILKQDYNIWRWFDVNKFWHEILTTKLEKTWLERFNFTKLKLAESEKKD